LFLCRHQFGETVVETVVFQKSQSSIHFLQNLLQIKPKPPGVGDQINIFLYDGEPFLISEII
jgi:hypothetical protein